MSCGYLYGSYLALNEFMTSLYLPKFIGRPILVSRFMFIISYALLENILILSNCLKVSNLVTGKEKMNYDPKV